MPEKVTRRSGKLRYVSDDDTAVQIRRQRSGERQHGPPIFQSNENPLDGQPPVMLQAVTDDPSKNRVVGQVEKGEKVKVLFQPTRKRVLITRRPDHDRQRAYPARQSAERPKYLGQHHVHCQDVVAVSIDNDGLKAVFFDRTLRTAQRDRGGTRVAAWRAEPKADLTVSMDKTKARILFVGGPDADHPSIPKPESSFLLKAQSEAASFVSDADQGPAPCLQIPNGEGGVIELEIPWD